MGMTITEKILARHAGRQSVAPGENIWVKVDVLMTHDVCGPGTIGVFQKEFGDGAKVFDPEKVVIIPDHYIFTADPKAHRNIEILRDFVKAQGIKYYYDPDFVAGEGMPDPYADPAKTPYKGVCHVAQHRRRIRPGRRQALAEGAADDALHLRRRGAALHHGQGHDPPRHRRHLHRRGDLPGDGVRRRGR